MSGTCASLVKTQKIQSTTPDIVSLNHSFGRWPAEQLALGTNVILDFGFWAREEREEFRSRAKELGASSEVHFLDVPHDELLRRLAQRNAQLSKFSFRIPEEMMKPWIAFFQKPTPDELGRRD